VVAERNQAIAGSGLETEPLITELAEYVASPPAHSALAYETAWLSLRDSIGVAFMAYDHPDCTKLLGPWIPGMAGSDSGARVPGSSLVLDLMKAVFDTGALIRWLDYNDTWLAAEWAHPSDNLAALLPLSDYLCRSENPVVITIRDLLSAMIEAYEIQGTLALTNSLNAVGIDHVVYVRVASAGLATRLLGGSRPTIENALTQAFADGGPLRAYRHHPNTGSRKSWAAADAASRGIELALLSLRNEMGYPRILSAPRWGFNTVVMRDIPLQLGRPLGSYVMENILYKVDFPAEFHGQTAAEAAVRLHPAVRDRLDEIAEIVIETQSAAIRIIDKTGPLRNPADRDHCLQYIVASALLRGRLVAQDYEEGPSSDPWIDKLRSKMRVVENPEFTRRYYDPEMRYIGNALQIYFNEGPPSERVVVEVPLGHRERREEARPRLSRKFREGLARLTAVRADAIAAFLDAPWQEQAGRPVSDLMDLLASG
jgi:2-methylcitrate dehydratase